MAENMEYAKANLQWVLYKLFKIKSKYPCGCSKHSRAHYCHLWQNEKNSIIINNGNDHRIVCKVCGSTHLISSEYITGFEIYL